MKTSLTSMYKTTGYRIEAVNIEQTPRAFRKVWFLDAVQVDSVTGVRSTSNICSGDERYCRKTLAQIKQSGKEWGEP